MLAIILLIILVGGLKILLAIWLSTLVWNFLFPSMPAYQRRQREPQEPDAIDNQMADIRNALEPVPQAHYANVIPLRPRH